MLERIVLLLRRGRGRRNASVCLRSRALMKALRLVALVVMFAPALAGEFALGPSGQERIVAADLIDPDAGWTGASYDATNCMGVNFSTTRSWSDNVGCGAPAAQVWTAKGVWLTALRAFSSPTRSRTIATAPASSASPPAQARARSAGRSSMQDRAPATRWQKGLFTKLSSTIGSRLDRRFRSRRATVRNARVKA